MFFKTEAKIAILCTLAGFQPCTWTHLWYLAFVIHSFSATCFLAMVARDTPPSLLFSITFTLRPKGRKDIAKEAVSSISIILCEMDKKELLAVLHWAQHMPLIQPVSLIEERLLLSFAEKVSEHNQWKKLLLLTLVLVYITELEICLKRNILLFTPITYYSLNILLQTKTRSRLWNSTESYF